MLRVVSFNSYYDVHKNRFYLYADDYQEEIDRKYLISDSYCLNIYKDNGRFYADANTRILPEERGIFDAHVNGDGTLCVAAKNSLAFIQNSTTFSEFKNRLLIPFLYANSFEEKFKKRPWATRGHNMVGVIEEYHFSNDEVKSIIFEETLKILSTERDKVIRSQLMESDLSEDLLETYELLIADDK